MENINTTKYPNGLTIISETIPFFNSFSLGLFFDVGSRDESLHNNGISHFIEHMLFKGTEKRNAKKISDDVESLGGYLNAYTSKEHTCYYGRGLNKNFGKTYSVLADMVQNSVFSEKEIKKEAGVILDEYYDIEDSPEEIIFDRFETKIFDGCSLSLPIIGTEENIKSFNDSQIKTYYSENYTFNRLLVVVSGGIEHSELQKLTEKLFTKDLGKSEIKRTGVVLTNPSNEVIEKDVTQTHVIIGKPTFGIKDNKKIGINLISQMLGEGSSSRLFHALREKKGITYQINTFVNSNYDYSAFGVYFSTNGNSYTKATDIVFNEFNKFLNGKVSKTELNRAKEYMKGNLIYSLENTVNRINRIASLYFYFKRVKSLQEEIDEIDSVSLDEIIEIANSELMSEKFYQIIISSNKVKLFKDAA